jgi:hypothetical protein
MGTFISLEEALSLDLIRPGQLVVVCAGAGDPVIAQTRQEIIFQYSKKYNAAMTTSGSFLKACDRLMVEDFRIPETKLIVAPAAKRRWHHFLRTQ